MLARHLATLAQNTKHRNPSDDPDVRRMANHRMIVMLMEFPARIAIAAIDRWPTTMEGEWYPTEHHLRLLCVEIQRAQRPPSRPAIADEYTHGPEHREAMKRRLHGLDRFLKTGDPGADPVLIAAKRKQEARERMAHEAGFASVDAWLAGKR